MAENAPPPQGPEIELVPLKLRQGRKYTPRKADGRCHSHAPETCAEKCICSHKGWLSITMANAGMVQAECECEERHRFVRFRQQGLLENGKASAWMNGFSCIGNCDYGESCDMVGVPYWKSSALFRHLCGSKSTQSYVFSLTVQQRRAMTPSEVKSKEQQVVLYTGTIGNRTVWCCGKEGCKYFLTARVDKRAVINHLCKPGARELHEQVRGGTSSPMLTVLIVEGGRGRGQAYWLPSRRHPVPDAFQHGSFGRVRISSRDAARKPLSQWPRHFNADAVTPGSAFC